MARWPRLHAPARRATGLSCMAAGTPQSVSAVCSAPTLAHDESSQGVRMKVGIVGLGYVGLPLALAFAEEGHDVVGVESDARKVAAISRGESYIEDVPSERLAAVSDRVDPPPGHARLSRCGAGRVARPTPPPPH